jgi:hypothetical protein
MTRPSRLLPILMLSLSLPFAPSPGWTAAPETAPTVPSAEAGQFVGETITVCGPVVSASYFEHIRGEPTFLNFDRPYPDQTFTVVIWGRNRGKFDVSPHRLYADKQLCVTGTVDTYKGMPQIVVESPDQIEVGVVPFEPDRFSYEERVVLKAILAALEYEVDYGSGEWDAEANLAMTTFQEQRGLEDEGDRSARTLRALAEAVEEIGDEDRLLILRLLLLNLVQREESAARK